MRACVSPDFYAGLIAVSSLARSACFAHSAHSWQYSSHGVHQWSTIALPYHVCMVLDISGMLIGQIFVFPISDLYMAVAMFLQVCLLAEIAVFSFSFTLVSSY